MSVTRTSCLTLLQSVQYQVQRIEVIISIRHLVFSSVKKLMKRMKNGQGNNRKARPSGLRQSLLLNVVLFQTRTSKWNAFRERAAYFITALLYQRSQLNNYQKQSRGNRDCFLLWSCLLPALSCSIGVCGPRTMQTDEGVPAAACNLLSPPPHLWSCTAPRWLSEQPQTDIAACCISILVTISLPAPSIKVSASLAIRVRHRLFDAEVADRTELNQHR